MMGSPPLPHYHGDGNGCYCEPEPESEPSESRLYVLVRRDLPKSVQAVQGIHAVMVLMHRNAWLLAADPTCVTISMLGLINLGHLNEWRERLGDDAATFCEPDIGNEPTALAYYGKAQSGFDQLRLL